MSERKIVVCSTQVDAQTQQQILQRDGYQATSPEKLARIIWDATNAGGANDIRTNAWVLVGSQ